jgi:repressor LexA
MLTKKQEEILELIINYIDENKISPTVRELTALYGLKSTATMHEYLSKLRKRGYINWFDGMPRTLKVLKR